MLQGNEMYKRWLKKNLFFDYMKVQKPHVPSSKQLYQRVCTPRVYICTEIRLQRRTNQSDTPHVGWVSEPGRRRSGWAAVTPAAAPPWHGNNGRYSCTAPSGDNCTSLPSEVFLRGHNVMESSCFPYRLRVGGGLLWTFTRRLPLSGASRAAPPAEWRKKSVRQVKARQEKPFECKTFSFRWNG